VIESTVDGRYQIIARIASGGMGEVYRAHDAVLGREVAVKILHSQLAGDRGFVERFRREARSAAILSHPNIVGVYDWGVTEGTYFMVMEFVRGHNLRAVLLERRRLEPAQVVEVSTQVLAALDHAHGHGIVHRDVKPENILIAEDGTVKVADFGLARAFADSTISQAEGTVTGTVQYLAPEQIQGEPADPRTDLYALGVVMFELLTGNPPFSGETSLAIAYQHLTDRVPAPSSVAPTIGPALDGPVAHATEKDRELRPASARALAEEVAAAARGVPPAPSVAEVAAQIPSTEFVPDERAPTVTIPRALSPRARRMRALRRAGLVLLVLALLGVAGWAVWEFAIPRYTHVPDVSGLTVPQAEARLKAAGLSWVEGDPVFSHTVPGGSVVTTHPPEGTRVRTRTRITIIPSKGPHLVGVPDVRGQTQADALAALDAAGFTVTVKKDFSDSVPKGSVMGQSPDPGTKYETGQPVTITVSQGPELVRIPDVSGQPADVATGTLQSLGLDVVVQKDFSATVPKGSVISTDPPTGQSVPKGSTVTLLVSKGPATFAMPNVIGDTSEAATAALEALGLHVRQVQVPGSIGDTVVGQDPSPGVTVHQGQTVTIFVGG
jgi:serine/threonine-protein kinase